MTQSNNNPQPVNTVAVDGAPIPTTPPAPQFSAGQAQPVQQQQVVQPAPAPVQFDPNAVANLLQQQSAYTDKQQELQTQKLTEVIENANSMSLGDYAMEAGKAAFIVTGVVVAGYLMSDD